MTRKVNDRPTTNSKSDGLYPHPPQYAKDGTFHTPHPGPHANFKGAPNERIIQNEGSFIVLGTDRPTSTASGYGAMGSDKANSIDLVVGRMSNAREGEGPPGLEDGTAEVDNSPHADAARILISQLTDVDKNFGLAAGNTGPSKSRASIALKADTVRVIGREGVNIVTGEALDVEGYGLTGETNSMGGRIVTRAPQINLIAGNHTGTFITFGGIYHPLENIRNLQPAVRGELARDALLEYAEVIEDMMNILMIHAITNMFHNQIIAFLFPWYNWGFSLANASFYNAMNSPWILQSLYQMRTTLNFINFNYCNSGGYKYICSRNVHLT